jgi:hypothetical protein
MQKRRYEIHLPLTYNDGRPISSEAFEETREELIARFGGVTIAPHSVRGVWVHAGTRYEDELIRLIVDVEDTAENRQFFVEWKPTLLRRFSQIEIYITSMLIEVI